jgi:hypothetical protein
MIGSYNRPAVEPRKASVGRQRAVKIAVLGLVWAIGILAVAVEWAGAGAPVAARPAKSATAR